MIKWFKLLEVMGFFVCLILMYTSEHGIRGIRTYDSTFRLFDMRFHYSSKEVFRVFEVLGREGRQAYQRFLILDFIFIICFLTIMLMVTNLAFDEQSIKRCLSVICVLRAVFDIMENILLFILLYRYPVFHSNLVRVCAWFTTMKFIMLYTWILSLVFGGVVKWRK
jgi:hypothetical protein